MRRPATQPTWIEGRSSTTEPKALVMDTTPPSESVGYSRASGGGKLYKVCDLVLDDEDTQNYGTTPQFPTECSLNAHHWRAARWSCRRAWRNWYVAPTWRRTPRRCASSRKRIRSSGSCLRRASQ